MNGTVLIYIRWSPEQQPCLLQGHGGRNDVSRHERQKCVNDKLSLRLFTSQKKKDIIDLKPKCWQVCFNKSKSQTHKEMKPRPYLQSIMFQIHYTTNKSGALYFHRLPGKPWKVLQKVLKWKQEGARSWRRQPTCGEEHQCLHTLTNTHRHAYTPRATNPSRFLMKAFIMRIWPLLRASCRLMIPICTTLNSDTKDSGCKSLTTHCTN